MEKAKQIEAKARKELNEAREKTAHREISESLQRIEATEKILKRQKEEHKKLLEKDISEFAPTWVDNDESPNMSTEMGYVKTSSIPTDEIRKINNAFNTYVRRRLRQNLDKKRLKRARQRARFVERRARAFGL